jgi:hypothetical protein
MASADIKLIAHMNPPPRLAITRIVPLIAAAKRIRAGRNTSMLNL